MTFFNNLNYTFNNEDSEFELKVLKKNTKKILVVAGSGGRVLSLFYKQPEEVNVIDISKEQLFLTELKIETLKQLSYDDYIYFWNYFNLKNNSKKRKKIFENLILDGKIREYFLNIFTENNWNSILYSGKWEKAFLKISKINNFITGNNISNFFDIKTKEDHKDFLDNKFPWKRFKFSLWLQGRALMFNSFLYKGKFPKSNMEVSLYKFYSNTFEKIFKNIESKNNFFLHFLFLGKIKDKNSLPFEAQKENFKKIKQGIKKAKINFIEGKIDDNISELKEIDFFSASDIISYYEKDKAFTFLKNIKDTISKNGIIVNRNYLNIPIVDISEFNEISNKYLEETDKEKTQMYKIKIYLKK